MERNKKIILILVAVMMLSGLSWFIYATIFKSKEQKKEPEGFQFEVPEISDKKEDYSKIEYYNTLITTNRQTSKGFLLNDTTAKENDTTAKENDTTVKNLAYEESDFYDNVSIDDNPQGSVNESTPQVEENEDLSRLLDIMESNTEYLNNNINQETSRSDNNITDNRALEQIMKEIPDFKGNISPPVNDIAASDDDDHHSNDSDIKYKKILKEKESPFLGVTKSEYAFNGAFSDDTEVLEKELFQAELYNTQVVENGGLLMIHLLEDVYFNKNYFIPKNTVLYGTAQFSPRRLFLRINPSIIENSIKLPSPMIVYDFDGLEGVFMNVNQLANIPVETARELTALVQESYKNSNSIIPSTSTVPLKEAAIISGSEKTLKYLNRLKIKMYGGYKVWLSIDDK